MKFQTLVIYLWTAAATVTVAYGVTSHFAASSADDQLCFSSNSIPDHPTGTFPNSGNPNAISEQSIEFCVDGSPEKGDRPERVIVTGIAKNGVIIRPGTADFYDASSPRRHSRDRSSGWNLDGMGARDELGLDQNNAHVGPGGVYHYHGVPPTLAAGITSEDTRIGWAADGFEIHYIGDAARPSYQLKSGLRSTAPGGAYDGTYNQDFEFVRGLGNLDECNGAMLNGTYTYFATDGYPYYPRCLYGTEITRLR